jgi:hypothetical protein
VIGLLLLICFLSLSPACHSYNPALYPSYDVLNPGPEVTMNPLSFDKDGNAVVNQAFILWVYELRQEVKKLRAELEKK